jgi:hypothetical protein
MQPSVWKVVCMRVSAGDVPSAEWYSQFLQCSTTDGQGYKASLLEWLQATTGEGAGKGELSGNVTPVQYWRGHVMPAWEEESLLAITSAAGDHTLLICGRYTAFCSALLAD